MGRSPNPERYLLTTFGITWPAWWTLAATGGVDRGPAALLLVGGTGPLVAAFAGRDRAGRRALLRSSLRVDRLGGAWGPVLAVAVGPALAATAAATLVGPLEAVALTTAVGALGFGLLAGIAEEPGWRGTLLGPWVEQHGPIRASVQVGLVWAVWHLPLYFASGTYQADQGLGAFALSLLVLPALSILFTWLMARAGGLVAAAVEAHALGNAAGEILPGEGTAANLTQAAVIVAAGAWISRRLRR